jgi:hypothetical protein
MGMMKKQRGMTFLGFVIVAVIGLSLVLAGVKVVPVYIEFASVKKVIQRIGEDSNFASMSRKEIADTFDKAENVGYVTVVSGSDLIIGKDESGGPVVSVEYQVVEHLAFNLSALMDFEATTEK